MVWLRMPITLRNAMLAYIPELEASEALRLTQIMSVGTGSIKQAAANQILSQWTRQAAAGRPVRTPEIDPQARDAILRGMQIGVELVPPPTE